MIGRAQGALAAIRGPTPNPNPRLPPMSTASTRHPARGPRARAGFIVAGLCLAAWAAVTDASSFGAVHAAAALWLAAAAHARWMPRAAGGGGPSHAGVPPAADGENLPGVLDDVMQQMHPLARRQGVDLWLHAPASATAPRVADATALRAVLLALVGHAVDHCRHGRIDVSYEIEPVAAGAAPAAPRLRLWVRHGGPGLEPDPLRHTVANGGALAECRRQVTAMGGCLMVHSDPQAGTVLRLAVPMCLVEPPATVDAVQPPAGPAVRPCA